jgi:hypothetical protein
MIRENNTANAAAAADAKKRETNEVSYSIPPSPSLFGILL